MTKLRKYLEVAAYNANDCCLGDKTGWWDDVDRYTEVMIACGYRKEAVDAIVASATAEAETYAASLRASQCWW